MQGRVQDELTSIPLPVLLMRSTSFVQRTFFLFGCHPFPVLFLHNMSLRSHCSPHAFKCKPILVFILGPDSCRSSRQPDLGHISDLRDEKHISRVSSEISRRSLAQCLTRCPTTRNAVKLDSYNIPTAKEGHTFCNPRNRCFTRSTAPLKNPV